MFGSGDVLDGVDEFPPVVALRGEHAPPFGGEPVEAPPPLAGLLDPASRDPAALLEAVEEGIERGDLEADPSVGSLLDQLADLVAVARTGLDEREDEELGAPFLQLAVEHPRDMLHSDISYRGLWRPCQCGGRRPRSEGRGPRAEVRGPTSDVRGP